MRYAPAIELPEEPFRLASSERPVAPPADRRFDAPLSREGFRDHIGLAYGLDLVNRGFYWEAHDVWEGAWRATARGPERELLQGLIQLAAARLQDADGNADGVASLRQRAHGHLARARAGGAVLCGIDVGVLLASHDRGGELRWKVRSRDLHATLSDIAVQPLECVFEIGDGCIIQTSPTQPSYYTGRVLFLDEPLALSSFPEWKRRARAALASQGPGFHNLAWEVEGIGPPIDAAALAEVGDGLALDRFDVLRADALCREPPRPDGVTIRPLATDAEWAAAGEFSGELNVAEFGECVRDFSRWRWRCYRETAALRGVAFYGAFTPEGEIVGSLGIVSVGDFYRYQDVQTREDHRRRGIAGRLCFQAFTDAQAAGVGPAIIVADSGSDAGRLYRSLGFEQVSTSYYLKWTYPSE